MQGVRTTTGCFGCKRRKKGCDFKTPSCSRCQRLREVCEYPARQYRFVNTPTSSADRRSRSPLDGSVAGSSNAGQRSHSPLIPGQASLYNTERELQIVVRFWDIYLPNEDPRLDGSIGGIRSAPWIPIVRALSGGNEGLQEALRAVAFTGAGWWHDEAPLLDIGLQAYIQALKKVNVALRDPRQALSDGTLATCRILSLYEMFRRPGEVAESGAQQTNGHRNHVNGAGRLLELRGIAQHQSGVGLFLFDGVQVAGISHALMARQPNAVTRLGWKRTGDTTLRSELFELQNAVPKLLEEEDRLDLHLRQLQSMASRGQVAHDAVLLLGQELALVQQMNEWEARAKMMCQMHDAVGSPDPFASFDLIAPNLLDICTSHGYAFFFACAQFWASSLILHWSCQTLHNVLAKYVPTLPPLPAHIDPEPYCNAIAQVAPHFFETSGGLWAAQSATLPLGSTLRYLASIGRQGTPQFQRIIGSMTTTKAGRNVLDFLLAAAGEQAKDASMPQPG